MGDVATLTSYSLNPYAIPVLVSGLVMLSLGCLALSKNSKSVVNIAFFLTTLSLSIWLLGITVVYCSRVEQVAVFWNRVFWSGVVFIGSSIYFFTVTVLGLLNQKSRSIKIGYLLSSLFLLSVWTGDQLISGANKYFWGYYAKAGPLIYPFLAIFFVQMVLSFYSYYRAYRLAAIQQSRRQIKATFVAFIIAYIGSVDYLPAIGIAVYPFGYLPMLLFVSTIFYSIVKHRLMDISTVVHKTAMWMVMSSLVAVPVVGGFYVVHGTIRGLSPMALSLLVALTVLVTIPYVNIIQPKIDHLFQRRKYDLQDVLQGFIHEVSTLKTLDELVDKLHRTISSVLYPSHASVVLFDVKSDALRPVRAKDLPAGFDAERHQIFLAWLQQHDTLVEADLVERESKYSNIRGHAKVFCEDVACRIVVPLIHDGKLLGLVNVGQKRNLRAYTRTEIAFLADLKVEAAIAFSNSLLYDDVSRMSLELKQWASGLEQKVEERTKELAESKTELQSSYEKLREMDQAKSLFFANVSHELRTPLTLILAPVESLLKGEMGELPPIHRRQMDMMHQNGLRLLKQINNLLDLAKLDAGRMELQYRSGNLSAMLRGLVASVAPMAEKKQIVLTGRETTPVPGHTYFDQDRFEKVVLNLVFNAIKFTNAGGRVEVMWGLAESGALRVQVRDTGIGIASEDLPKLFKRFSQVESGVNRRYEGTGIGLALAKEIVELHGGTIQVESEVGRGTTMTFTIPLLLEPPAGGAEETEGQAPPSSDVDWTRQLHVAAEHQMGGVSDTLSGIALPSLSPSNGVQILVVEDNPDMREFVGFELQGEYRVLKAANGIEGMRVAGEALPDVIISDVMMPEMDGYQLCREIRKDPRTMHIPIILLTARADMAMKIEGLEHGADDYLTKPFNAQELRAKIKSLLEQRRLEREIQQRNEALEAALEELKATQAQLVQSEKMAGLGMLVAGMAHEINNPINFAKNSLSVLQRAWDDLKPLLAQRDVETAATEAVEDVEASLGIVKNGVSRTEQIVSQLKAFVRKDQNRKIAFSVQEGLASTLELIRPTMGKQIVLHADMQSTCPILAVPGKLNQVWMNLLQNAVQAVGESGEIWVESRDHEHMVTVTVRDSGPGIKPEHLPRLFEPFFTTKPVGQGTGLGLSVSYQIVRDAGGRIDVKSEPGRGAEFTVVLPLARVLSQAA